MKEPALGAGLLTPPTPPASNKLETCGHPWGRGRETRAQRELRCRCGGKVGGDAGAACSSKRNGRALEGRTWDEMPAVGAGAARVPFGDGAVKNWAQPREQVETTSLVP